MRTRKKVLTQLPMMVSMIPFSQKPAASRELILPKALYWSWDGGPMQTSRSHLEPDLSIGPDWQPCLPTWAPCELGPFGSSDKALSLQSNKWPLNPVVGEPSRPPSPLRVETELIEEKSLCTSTMGLLFFPRPLNSQCALNVHFSSIQMPRGRPNSQRHSGLKL